MILDLSIVLPAWSEARYLDRTFAELLRYLESRGRLATTEIVAVTAEASDGTADIVRTSLLAFPHVRQIEPGPKVGKGRDVRLGMLAARGANVLFMDADLATPIAHIDEALAAIANGADVAIGIRDVAHMHDDVSRRASSQLANWLVRALLLPGIPDTQCGFKAFRGAIVRELFEPLFTRGWGFDFEVLARARRAGHSIALLPISDWADPKGDYGLAGEIQWLARLRTFGELVVATAKLGRQGAARPR